MQPESNIESYYYLKSATRLLKRHWYLFAFSVAFFIGIAEFLNWYFQPVYEVGSIILIDDEVAGNKPDPSHEFMKSFSIFTAANDIQLEILKMKSLDLVYKALESIHSEVTYYSVNGIKTKELYSESPFQVSFRKDHIQPVGVKFNVTPTTANKFRIQTAQSDEPVNIYNYAKHKAGTLGSLQMNKEFTYGDTIQSDYYSFQVTCSPERLGYSPVGTRYYFLFNDLNMLSYSFQKEIMIDQLAKDVHAASIKLKSKNVQKGIDLINALTIAYLQRNVDKKNFVAGNTIQYLDNQLSVIEDSLKLTENKLQEFRSSQKVMEIGAKADQEFKGATELENQREELQAKTNYYNYVINTLDKDHDLPTLLVPSSMGVNDNVLTGVIEDYIKLYNERNSLIQNNQTGSVYFKSLTTKINNQKNTLSENIRYLINTNNLLLHSTEERLRKKNAQITVLPAIQREMVGIERKYKLNDNIYNYMLQKKAEAEVAKASNLHENDILEPVRLLQPTPVFPNKMMNLGIAFVIGLLFPFAGFGMKDFMNNTIRNEQEVMAQTEIPFLGRIYNKKGRKSHAVLLDAPKSAISESFRTVRTNLDHFLEGKNNQVILLTSTAPEEGKSFVSLNLASSLALLGRKTVLVSFDIRKPGIYPALKLECQLGVSSILSGRATLEEALETTAIPHLDFIGSGPVLQNPSELIGSKNTEPLIAELRKRYDYVIIDTPPLGLVTDAYLLMKHSDLKIFIVREKVTPRDQLSRLMKELENKKITQFCWLINGVDATDTFYGKKNQYFSQD
jgi:capsular exopolysaccharide synthesis family protein